MEPTERRATRVRREPPKFRRGAGEQGGRVSPRLARVVLRGNELSGFTVDEPAASVRILLPPPGSTDLVVPTWNGNEFLRADGTRPTIRTLTPRHVDAE